MKFRHLFFPLLILILACSPSSEVPESTGNISPNQAITPLQDYATLKTQIRLEQDSLHQAYLAANPRQKALLLAQSRTLILNHLSQDLIPQWYGTAWDFNGITQTPREGKIACGYFVSTLLRDAGFQVQRARMAQQASLYIIRSLSPKAQRQRWTHISTATFAERMAAQPQGLYVIGLDIHTGFILHDAAGVWFIHASYGNPAVVVREAAATSAVLAQSQLFVLGRVDNDWLLKKWLNQEKVATVTK
ncbi:MAG TPA: hypothetical protein ENJ82_15335 [Bacteroidetes bacterium]|nr:hypothetical protein [Bacteroidota bacterium]